MGQLCDPREDLLHQHKIGFNRSSLVGLGQTGDTDVDGGTVSGKQRVMLRRPLMVTRAFIGGRLHEHMTEKMRVEGQLTRMPVVIKFLSDRLPIT